MSQTLRIEEHPILGKPDRQLSVSITVAGQDIAARPGEPIAAALLAQGIRAVRTMAETGEPRGIFTAVGRSIEELGTVNGEANVPLMATTVEDGMIVEIQQGLGNWGESV